MWPLAPALFWIGCATEGIEEARTKSCFGFLCRLNSLLLFKFVFNFFFHSGDFPSFSYSKGNPPHKCVGLWMPLRGKEWRAYFLMLGIIKYIIVNILGGE